MKKISKILSLILALSLVLSAFCFGTVSADGTTDTNILLNNANISITPLQVLTEGLDWTKTEFSYEGMEISDSYLTAGSYGALTNGDYADVTQINSKTGVTLTAKEIATRRLALKVDLGNYYDTSLVKIGVQNGGWAPARRIYSYNVYGVTQYDSETVLNDSNLIGSFIVDGNNYYTAGLREATFESTTVRYIVIVFNLLGTDPGMKDNAILTDLTDAPVTVATSYIYDGSKNTGYDAVAGMPYLSEIEIYGSTVAQSNVLSGNSNVTFSPLQIATDGLDWTASSFSYEGLEISDANLVAGSFDTLIDGDYTTATQIDSSNTLLSASEIATRRLALKVDLGGYYNASSIKVDTTNGSWAAARRLYSYNVYGAAKYDADTILNDENLIGTFMVDGNNYYGDAPREANLEATDIRYVVIVFNLLGSDPGLKDNTIMTDLTDVPVVPATSYLFTDLNGSNSGYAGHVGRPFLSEIEIVGFEVEQSNVLSGNSKVTFSPLQIATDGLDWTASSFSYEGLEISDANLVAGSFDTLIDGDYTTATQIDSSNTLLSASEIATRRLALKVDLGGYYNASSIKVDTTNGSWAAARRLYSYNVYGAAKYDADTILNDENLIGTFMVDGNNYYGDAPREANLEATDIRYVVIVFNLLGSDPGLKDNTIMTDLTDVPVVSATSYLFTDLNGLNSDYTSHVGRPFLSEIEIFGSVNSGHTDDILLGDIDGNDVIDVRDLIRLKKYYAFVNVIVIEYNLDVNKDGVKDTLDIVALRQQLLNK